MSGIAAPWGEIVAHMILGHTYNDGRLEKTVAGTDDLDDRQGHRRNCILKGDIHGRGPVGSRSRTRDTCHGCELLRPSRHIASTMSTRRDVLSGRISHAQIVATIGYYWRRASALHLQHAELRAGDENLGIRCRR